MVLKWKIETVKPCSVAQFVSRFQTAPNILQMFFFWFASSCNYFFHSQIFAYNSKIYPNGGVWRKQVRPDRPRRKKPMSKPSQTDGAYVQSRPSCVYAQIFVRLPDFRAFNRFSCVHVQICMRLPGSHAFMSRLLCNHPTFVRSTNFRACMSRLSSVQQTFVRSCPDFRALPDFCWFMSRFLCVHQTRVRWSNFCLFELRHEKFIQIKHNWRGRFPVFIASK